MLPPIIQVREVPGQVVIKLAEGKLHRLEKREVVLLYIFDGFRSNGGFLVMEMNYAFDYILGMPRLAHYKPQIDWLPDQVDIDSSSTSVECLPISWFP